MGRSTRTSSATRGARRKWDAARRKHIKPGGIYFIDFQHDEACAIYTPFKLCHCNVTRVLMDDTRHVLARVEGAGPYDPLELVEGQL
jgi:hypothetical protein